MKNAFIRLSEEIKYNPTDSFKNINIEKANLIDSNIFELKFKNIEIIPQKEMENFIITINNNFKYKTKISFEITSIVYDLFEFKKYLKWVLEVFIKQPHLAQIIFESKFEVTENNVTGYIDNSKILTKANMVKKTLEDKLKKLGYNDLNLEFKLDSSNYDILEKEKMFNNQEASKVIFNKDETVSVNENSFKKEKHFVPISELSETQHNSILTEGEIFSIKESKTKSGWFIFTFSITDFKDAIYVKIFVRSEKDVEAMRSLIKGTYISIDGNLSIDKYTKELTLVAKKIKKIGIQKEQRKDNSKIKRVELNAKTRMSTMDGVIDPRDYVERAKEWGHKAIAIVDTDSVQSFPNFYWTAKDSGVKPIYGSTFSTISKSSNAIKNIKDKSLADDTYIIFDIETTGLSPIFNEIIEFGAVKIKNGEIIEEKQFFIKPSQPISKFTKDLTGIKDEDLENAISQEDGIKKIADYLRSFTTVAHNANFDITFINQKLYENNLELLSDPIIDSMIVGRIIHPKAKRFRLENVATRLKVYYDSTVAHRADYDAGVLARVWIKLMNLLIEKGISTQEELQNYNIKELREKAFSYKVTVLAKNQKGLKELFQLTTESLTDDFARGPKLIFENIKNKKDILLGTGALRSRLVDRMFFGSKKQIMDEISHYDYIEIQPLQNYKHYTNRDFSESQVKEILKFVAYEAKKQNKLVVATGDVRYLDKKDKIYHEVYINSKGLGGVLHYLYKRNEQNPVYPDQHFLTTQEMIESFSFLEDVDFINEVVIENTNKIADSIDNVQIIKDKLYTPKFGDSDKNLIDLVYKTAKEKYGENLPEIVEKRLEKELQPITKYGFSVIYWISHLLVKKSLDDGYLVGSRGSVGSSLVATLANITEVNPMCPYYICSKCKYSEFFENSKLNSGYDLVDKKCPECSNDLSKEGQNIPFETFLGFNANKVPDIDLNFSGDNQADIHNYVKELFGDKHAFRAGTISTVAEKTAFGYVKAWAMSKDKHISKAFIEYLAKGLTGTKRTTGQHPGGIIVIPGEFDVEDFCPVNYPANDENSSWKTTHFDFHAIHDNVLKLDILGHDDPTAIKMLEKLTGIEAKKIPMSDTKIISLFSSPEVLGIKSEDILGEKTGAMGIPEFGTKFVRGMLKTAKVNSFGDLIAVSGLSHGTDVWATNSELLVRTQNKSLSEVISCRDNIMVDLTNKGLDPLTAFNIMESVRKGNGLTEGWEKELIKHEVEDWYIDSLKKIKYMFPKAHATAYVMMAWRIAYFKLYHPIEYYATYFTTRADVFDITTVVKGKEAVVEKLNDYNGRRFVKGENALTNKETSLIPILEIANEALARGINIRNIDINKSLAKEWIIDNKELIPPFSVIDGLGDAVANSIIEARNKKTFVSKEDLANRTLINKTTLGKLESMDILRDLSDTNQMTLDFGF